MKSLSIATPLAAIGNFVALLREHGYRVGIAEQQAMVQAASLFPVSSALARPAQLGEAWRAIACRDAREWRNWPELYERYWFPERVRGTTRVSGQTRPARDLRQVISELRQGSGEPRLPTNGPSMDSALTGGGSEGDEALSRARGGASRVEALHDRAEAEWLPQNLVTLQRMAERIAERLRKRLTRRWRDRVRGTRLDLRRTLRASLATGGLPLAPAWRQPRRERPRLFILVDVSKSMETHAQLFLRIARAFVLAADARVFVFHTRLAEITPLLRRDTLAVQEKINAVTAGFAGGTRIATSVADFSGVHARRQLGRTARVWLLSDGFDADEPHRLAEELRVLRRLSTRVTWFYPSEALPASNAMRQVMDEAQPLVQRFARLSRLRDLVLAADLID
jgi:uncharacterized protein with von Willebrand factor type A (vWA) domain